MRMFFILMFDYIRPIIYIIYNLKFSTLVIIFLSVTISSR